MWNFIKNTIICIVGLILCLVAWRLITWLFILIAFYGFHLDWYRDLAATITLVIIGAGSWFADDLNKKCKSGTAEADKKEDASSTEVQIVNEVVKKKNNKVLKIVGQVASTIVGLIFMVGLYLGVDNLIGDKNVKTDISVVYTEETTTVDYGYGSPRLDSTSVSESPVQTTQAQTVAAPEAATTSGPVLNYSEDYFESNNGEYDFGYNTNPDDVWYNPKYLTADAEIMKDNGYEGVDVNFSGDITFAAEYGGSAVSDKYWYNADTMSDLDVYYMSDPFGYGEYVILTGYQSRVFTGDNVTVYGTVINIDKNGVIYIAAQMIELQPSDPPSE